MGMLPPSYCEFQLSWVSRKARALETSPHEPHGDCAYPVNNLADPLYHNGWSYHAPLDDDEKMINTRSFDIALIRESFWKDARGL